MGQTISHRTGSTITDGPSTAEIAAATERRLRAADRLILPLDETLEMLARLQEFELGRFLLHNQGLNGYWTSYIFRYEPGTPATTPMEYWLLNNSLLCGARERFHRFKAAIAERLTEGAVLASVPCGVMDDLLQQDYRGLSEFRLVGMDIDAESLELAADNAATHGLAEHCEFIARDAWQLGVTAEFDLLVSNGLNMYESDPARLSELYANFASALRPGGRLLLSFLSPPPPPPWEDPSRAGEWVKYGIDERDLRRELALFGDIIQAKYLNFTAESEITAQLSEASLEVMSVDYSPSGVLPIVSAVKPG